MNMDSGKATLEFSFCLPLGGGVGGGNEIAFLGANSLCKSRPILSHGSSY